MIGEYRQAKVWVGDIFWHPMSEPHKNGKADGVELMDVMGRVYQAPGEVILDGMTGGIIETTKPITSCKAFAWRIKDGW